jgi:amphi-Trp domain-containing protein
MVNIPGSPGKADGNPSGPKEFEQEFYVNRSEAANFLRELADTIEAAGPVAVAREGWRLEVTPREPLKLEIQFKFVKKELEVQLKLKENP